MPSMWYPTKRIDGLAMAKEIFRKINMSLTGLTPGLLQDHQQPGLAIIQISGKADVEAFEAEKARAAKKCNFHYEVHHFQSKVTSEELRQKIEHLNTSSHIDGIVVQLPVPNHLSLPNVMKHIAIKKDVDALHPVNVGELWMGNDGPHAKPCTAVAVERMILSTNIELSGAHAVILGSGIMTGCPITRFLIRSNSTVTICNESTKNSQELCRRADVLISAVGKPHLVQANWVKPGAVVIDVGITRCKDGIRGHVDWNAIQGIASHASPCPGGVGPLTVALLMENTCTRFLARWNQ